MSNLKVNNIEAYSGSTITIDTNTVFNKNVTVSGNLIFGDADTDSIDFNADIVSNIVPDATNTYHLGSSAKQWGDLYLAGTATLASVAITGNLSVDGNTVLGDASSDTITVNGVPTFTANSSTVTIGATKANGFNTTSGDLYLNSNGGTVIVDTDFSVDGPITTSRMQNNSSGRSVYFDKARSTSFGIVSDGDDIGSLTFRGADGTALVPAARIGCKIGGAPGANDMPGKILFATTADGAASVSTRMVIEPSGRVGVGDYSSTAPDHALEVLSGSAAITNQEASSSGKSLKFKKSRQAGAMTDVQDDDEIGKLQWFGADGSAYELGAQISTKVSGAVATGNMPCRLVFATRAHGTMNVTEHMTIMPDGKVGVGTDNPSYDFSVDGDINLTGNLNFNSSTVVVDSIIDDDTLASASSTSLATSESIKAYIDDSVTAQDLDFQADTGGALSIDLDSETLSVLGGDGVTTTGATNNITIATDVAQTHVTSVGTLTSLSISGNLDVNTNVLKVDSSGGNVGIGLDAPLQPLHIYSNNNNSDPSVLIENDDAGGTCGIGFLSGTADNYTIGVAKVGTNFRIANGANLSTSPSLLDIDKATGNVGIGTDAPQNKLDVGGSVAIGAAYSGVTTATPNGLIVEGNIGAGIGAPLQPLHVYSNNANSDPSVLIENDNAGGACAIGFLSGTADNYTVGVAKVGTNFRICSGTNTSDASSILDVNRDTGSVIIGTYAAGVTPSASAKLEVTSTTAGFLPPRMTTAERDAISTPATGLLVYNTTDNTLQCWNGSSWQNCF